MTDEKKPSPGSQEAQDQGCTCAVLDNNHGEGFPGTAQNGETITCFWINGECPLHGK